MEYGSTTYGQAPYCSVTGAVAVGAHVGAKTGSITVQPMRKVDQFTVTPMRTGSITVSPGK